MASQAHIIGTASVILYRASNYIIETSVHQRTANAAIPLRSQWELVIRSVGTVACHTITGEVAYDTGHVPRDVYRLGR